jgi:hypothetical protein
MNIIVLVIDTLRHDHVAAQSAGCRFFRHGSRRDEARQHPWVVKELRERGIAELAARKADPRLVDWFGSHGSSPFPEESCRWPGQPGWSAYRGRTCNHW